jgi:phosphatidylinositol-3-phosphatase
MKAVTASLILTFAFVGTLFAQEGPVPKGVPRLDHVFVIMMENHGFNQIVNNPNAPFANQLAKSANSAINYFAIGHPSLTNYLEVVGGSNFGIRSDNNPDWHNGNCTTNLVSGIANLDGPVSSGLVCPISGAGTDAATPAIDTTNECPNPPQPCSPGFIDIDGSSIPAADHTIGKTIADQLAAEGRTWKSYQESLPPTGADNIGFSDGFFTDNPNIHPVPASETQSLIKLYAAKHNPFVYFRSVQEGQIPGLSLQNVVGFEGANGLFEDLSSGRVPQFSLIAPNQCNDQHGRGNAGPACDFDPNDDGSQAGLNPGLIFVGDLALRNLVNAIHKSPAWREGRNAIVVVWDENDFSFVPNLNQVLLIVDTNYGVHGVKSSQRYTHFSLLRSIEAGLRLPCLNHACDASAKVMSDLFASGDRDDRDDR